MWKSVRNLGLVMSVVSLLSACGTAASGAQPAGQAGGATGSSANEVVVYTAGPKNLADKLAKDFEQQTGIKVKLFQSTTGKVLGRLEAEKANPRADVVVLADWSAAQSLKAAGETYAFHPTNEAKLIWKDSASNYFAYSASALGITYNTKLIQQPPADWTDVTNPKWQGKVLIPDPSQSGSAVDFLGGYMQTHADWSSYFKGLKAGGTSFQGANAQALNEVLTGTKSMVLGGVDYMAYADKAKGEPIDIVYPKSGTVVNPRPVLILKSAHHIQNAEKFVNFLLSKAGQKDVVKDYLLPGRQDIAASPKRASLQQITQWNVDWAKLAQNKKQVIQEVTNILG